MSNPISAEELFLRLYETAIKTLWNAQTKHDDVGTNAANMARDLMQHACLIPGRSIVGASSAPQLTIVSAPVHTSGIPQDLSPNVHAPQSTIMSHSGGVGAGRFGAAFNGWPESEIVQCLAAIQEIVLGLQYNASAEQQTTSQDNLSRAIRALFEARVASASKPKA